MQLQRPVTKKRTSRPALVEKMVTRLVDQIAWWGGFEGAKIERVSGDVVGYQRLDAIGGLATSARPSLGAQDHSRHHAKFSSCVSCNTAGENSAGSRKSTSGGRRSLRIGTLFRDADTTTQEYLLQQRDVGRYLEKLASDPRFGEGRSDDAMKQERDQMAKVGGFVREQAIAAEKREKAAAEAAAEAEAQAKADNGGGGSGSAGGRDGDGGNEDEEKEATLDFHEDASAGKKKDSVLKSKVAGGAKDPAKEASAQEWEKLNRQVIMAERAKKEDVFRKMHHDLTSKTLDGRPLELFDNASPGCRKRALYPDKEGNLVHALPPPLTADEIVEGGEKYRNYMKATLNAMMARDLENEQNKLLGYDDKTRLERDKACHVLLPSKAGPAGSLDFFAYENKVCSGREIPVYHGVSAEEHWNQAMRVSCNSDYGDAAASDKERMAASRSLCKWPKSFLATDARRQKYSVAWDVCAERCMLNPSCRCFTFADYGAAKTRCMGYLDEETADATESNDFLSSRCV